MSLLVEFRSNTGQFCILGLAVFVSFFLDIVLYVLDAVVHSYVFVGLHYCSTLALWIAKLSLLLGATLLVLASDIHILL